MRRYIKSHRRMLVFVGLLTACAAIAAGFFDGAFLSSAQAYTVHCYFGENLWGQLVAYCFGA